MNKGKIKLIAQRVSAHSVFWIIIIITNTFVFGRANANFTDTFIHILATLPVYIGATYFMLYYILPKFLITKNYSGAILPVLYMVLSTAFFYVMITILFTFRVEPFEAGFKTYFDKSYFDVFIRLMVVYLVVFSAAVVKLLKTSYEIQNKNKDLISQKLTAELDLLKAQINPHFLFNTLNNLYSLALQKSDRTPDIILKLSELLDYFLYKCNSDKVLLSREIEMIDNYISLEKLRYTERLEIVFEHKNSNGNALIAPLLLIPFVENAFKHSGIKNIDKNFIQIRIKNILNKFTFEIKNSYKKNSEAQKLSGGIGLENVRKRLNYIYPEKHNLDILDTGNEFSVSLKIDLTDEE